MPVALAQAGASPPEVDQLMERGYFVRDGFLGPEAAMAASEAIAALYQAGKFSHAGMTPTGARRDLSLRGDERAWLEKGDSVHSRFAPSFDALRSALAGDPRMPLDTYFEMMAARYGGDGARYAAHLDATPKSLFHRRVTAIAYFNPSWEPAHGGLLRIHMASQPIDIEPRMDRLLVFLSEQIIHEVMPVFVPRLAVTAWFYAKM